MENEKELAMYQTYRQFLNAGLGLDSSISLADLLDRKIMGFGTAIDEKIFNVGELEELLARQKEQSKELDLRWEISPLSHYTSPDENTAVFADDILLQVGTGSESIKMYMRFSVVITYAHNQWKVLHWHGSKPENVQSEEDTFGIETWKQKAQAFEKLVEQRTADLVEKNRELAIEASLEKVRSRSMAMQKSQELKEVIKIVYEQIRHLKINLDHAGFVVDYTAGGDWHFWIADEQDTPSKITHPYFESVWANQFNEAKEKGTSFFATHLNFEEKNKFYHELLSHVPGLPDASKDFYLNCPALAVSTVLLENIGLYIENFSGIPYSDEENNILIRFAKVFEQAYTRFLDLQKAEAQAREAQIEAALERVRSRSLAMHQSDELQEVANTLFERLNELNVKVDSANIAIFEEGKRDFVFWVASLYQKGVQSFHIPYSDLLITRDLVNARENGTAFFGKSYSFEEKNEWFNYAFTNTAFQFLSEERKQMILEADAVTISMAFSKNTAIQVTNYSDKLLSEEKVEILKRFSKVFEQAYIRFLDLQHAEEQARESQIQLALERVRARTMAMQKSYELSETAVLLFHQITSLGLDIRGSGFNIWDKDEKTCTAWMSGPEGTLSPPFNLPLTEDPFFIRYYESRQNGEDFWVHETGKDELVARYKYLQTLPFIGELLAKDKKDSVEIELPPFVVDHVVNFSNGNLIFVTHKRYPEAWDIFKRFGKVFEQTYTRFLDLKKAEAQSREAQIEAALERVRARTMGMQKSDELPETSYLLFQQVKELGLTPAQNSIAIINEETGSIELSTTVLGHHLPRTLKVRMDDPYVMAKAVKAWKAKLKSLKVEVRGQELKDYNEHRNSFFETKVHFPEDQWIVNIIFFSKGWLSFSSNKDISDETFELLRRFTAVFEQTYTRFNDLKQAETQAKEAQIEAALEKIRSRSLAMHATNELGEVVKVIVEKLQDLGVVLDANGVILCTYFRHSKDVLHWIVSPDYSMAGSYLLPYFDHPIFNAAWHSKESGDDYFSEAFSVEEKNSFFEYAFEHSDYKHFPEEFKQWVFQNDKHSLSFAWQKNSAILIPSHTGVVPTEADKAILIRFSKVFEQAYVRFMDLQKSEAQAREATIEAALEKVRGKAMAMHNSNDLSVTASMIFAELRKLGINPIRCGVGLLTKESRKAQLYSATSSNDGDSLSLVGSVELSGHPVAEKIYDAWLKNEDYYPELSGEQLTSYYKFLLKGLPVPVPDSQDIQKQYGTFLYFSVGGLFTWSKEPYNEAEVKILKRFATIIDLTFRRYVELQKSEATAKEAVKQAALDRIRADIASMRTINDLDRITPLIWNELTILGVPFIRCGVFIMDDAQQLIHTFLSTPEGKAIAAFHLPYITPGNISQVLSHWQSNEKYVDHWDESSFTEFAETLKKQGTPDSSEQYLKTIPHGGFYLHFLPFLQGMLYVGNHTQLSEDEVNLIQSVADAFSTAYARYEDFNKLEAAKKQVDSTLNELQATQKQLIQSEKMASLGELTAGIAHEIQNPLNFVNNFSEVSNELLEEMIAELQKDNGREAVAIARDVKQNLEKILTHGKRADSIVKGMLQHSRNSTAAKELTDINKLVDEYSRLAFHGLRAKDNSFNATIKTNYDKSIGSISIVPQEIGRVILNLITNAFYTVGEKRKQLGENYEPIVEISTKKEGSKVEIRIADNGNGIPQKLLDKIFQPFFTTKPTGQGTGLGLSLSYDIVKAHGGEFKVKTDEGEGSEFTITLQQ